MIYEKTLWVDGQEPALNADNLNKIELGIEDSYLAENLEYDSSESGLAASTVQSAIDEINTDVQSLETTVLGETKVLCGISKTIPTVSVPGNGASSSMTIDFSADLPANATLVGCLLQTTPNRAFTDSGINIVGNSINLYFINLYSRAYNLTGATFILFYNISR